MTTQSVKETQALIEEKLGVDAGILSRAAFHGQHSMNDLLEATDARLKDELSLIVPLDLWQEASSIARARARDAKKRSDELEGMKRLRTMDAQDLSKKVDAAKTSMELRKSKLQEVETRMNALLLEIEKSDQKREDWNSDEVQFKLETIANEIQTLTALYQSNMKERDTEITPLEKELNDANAVIDSLRMKNSKEQMKVSTATISLDSAKTAIRRLEGKWSLNLSDGIPRVLKPPEECPTCHQPLAGIGDGHDHRNIEQTIKEEIEQAFEEQRTAEENLNEALSQSSECAKLLHAEEQSREEIVSRMNVASSQWKSELHDIEVEIQRKRDLQNELTSQLSSFVKESQLISQKDAAKASYDMEMMSFEHAKDTFKRLEDDLTECIGVIETD